MKKTIVDGHEFTLPRFISRVPGGWQVRVPGHKTKLFSDSKFTFGQAGQPSRLTASLLAATEHRTSLLPINEGDDPAPLKLGGMAVAENSGKQHKTGCPGVFSHHDGKSLLVVVKGMPTRTIPARMGVDAAIAIRNRLAHEKAQKLGRARR